MSEALWKIVIVGVLLFFGATGVRMMLNPDPFVRRSGMPKGGDMLRTWNRDGMRATGAVFVAVAVHMLYHVLSD